MKEEANGTAALVTASQHFFDLLAELFSKLRS
jgi:hypothetical protein